MFGFGGLNQSVWQDVKGSISGVLSRLGVSGECRAVWGLGTKVWG